MSFQIHESLSNNFYSSQINIFLFFHFEQFLTITEVLSFLKPRILLGLPIIFFQQIFDFIFIGHHSLSEIQEIWNLINLFPWRKNCVLLSCFKNLFSPVSIVIDKNKHFCCGLMISVGIFLSIIWNREKLSQWEGFWFSFSFLPWWTK